MLPITHDLTLDFTLRPVTPRLDMMQHDAGSRQIRIRLTRGGESWQPEGMTPAVAYRKPDGTSGLYDTLPDGSAAGMFDQDTVTLTLAPQVLTCPGRVEAALVLTDESLNRISSFPFEIQVAADPAAGQPESENYYNLTNLAQLNAAMEQLRRDLQAGTIQNAELSPYGDLVLQMADGGFTYLEGVTAYGIALQNGFEGTKEEWLASLGGDWVATKTLLDRYTPILENLLFAADTSGRPLLVEVPGFAGFEEGGSYRLTLSGETHTLQPDGEGKLRYSGGNCTVTIWEDLGDYIGLEVVTAEDVTLSLEKQAVVYNTLPGGYLPKATQTSLGGVRVGDGLQVDENGTLSVQAGSGWRLIGDVTSEEEVSAVTITSETPLSEMLVYFSIPPIPEDTGGTAYPQPGTIVNGRVDWLSFNVTFTKPNTKTVREIWHLTPLGGTRRFWDGSSATPGTVQSLVEKASLLTRDAFAAGGGYHGFRVFWNQSYVLPAGVILQVWGR